MQTLALLLQTQLPAVEVFQSGGSVFWLWFTFGGMFLATVAFLYLATSGNPGQYHHYMTSAVITLWAAVWYVVMANGGAASLVVHPHGTDIFYYGRYIDWVITTPLLLLGLSWVALGGNVRRTPRVVGSLLASDVLMILTGLIAGATGGGLRWFWFVVSSIFFVIVLYLIWVSLRSEAARGNPEGGFGLFFTLASMLTVLWVLYPIVWIFGTEGTGAIGSGVETFFFAVLDILAKIAFGFVLLGGIRSAQGTARRA